VNRAALSVCRKYGVVDNDLTRLEIHLGVNDFVAGIAKANESKQRVAEHPMVTGEENNCIDVFKRSLSQQTTGIGTSGKEMILEVDKMKTRIV
jgi:hypothetical protein